MSDYFKSRSVVLLGGANIIGSHLAEALIEQGVKSLRIIDNLSAGKKENIEHLIKNGAEFFQLDLRNFGIVTEAVRGQDIVFHLTSQHGGRGYVASHAVNLWNNLELDTTIYRACAYIGVEKVIFSSSACAYPVHLQSDIDKDVYLSEWMIDPDNVEQPDGAYGMEKLIGEKMLDAHVEKGDFKGVSTRSYTVYGPRMGETHAICAFIAKSMIKQEPFEIWGEPRGIIRNWTYVTDNVDGALLAAERLDNGAINIGTEDRMYPEDVLDYIWKYIGWEPDEIVYKGDKPTGPVNRVADSTKLRLLGWNPKVSLEEGLERTIEWYYSTHNEKDVRENFERKLTEV